jgi:hypothetical protein
MRVAIRAGQIEAANEERGGERVGGGGVRGDDRRAEDARGGPARARVDDVAVTRAVDLDELLARAAGAERGVSQAKASEPLAQRAAHHVDAPAAIRAAERDDGAAAGGDERVAHAPAPEGRADGLDGEPLADCAEVERHAGDSSAAVRAAAPVSGGATRRARD